MNAKEYLKVALGRNMNVSTLTPLAIEELMDGYAKHCAEKDNDKPESIADALDGLFGVCDNLCDICQMLVDSKDGRIVNADNALTKAQNAIESLIEKRD